MPTMEECWAFGPSSGTSMFSNVDKPACNPFIDCAPTYTTWSLTTRLYVSLDACGACTPHASNNTSNALVRASTVDTPGDMTTRTIAVPSFSLSMIEVVIGGAKEVAVARPNKRPMRVSVACSVVVVGTGKSWVR